MALFATPNFYQSQNISAAAASAATTTNFFPQTFNHGNIIQTPNINTQYINSLPSDSIVMKRRRGNDESEPSPKRAHYEERMAQRFDSLDLSNENPLPPIDPIDIMDDELEINEIDPEILSESPQSFNDEFEEEPIIEEPEDEDRIVLSDELHRYMKSANDHNILSKFQKKPSGNELVLWRPLSDLRSSSSDNPGPSMNDRITEVNDDDEEESDEIQNIADTMDQNLVTFPDESSSSARSSCSPPKNVIDNNDPVAFSSMSSSATSSCCSSDGNRPSRMPSANVLIPQNQPDYEPMEMD